MPEEHNVSSRVPGDAIADNRYVGFCDILGFSNRILTNFDGTLEIYKAFGSTMSSLPLKAWKLPCIRMPSL